MKEQEILSLINERLGISDLNDLQKSVLKNLKISSSAIIYSPTGSGKTLAFSVTLLKALKNFDTEKLQAVIIAPSRELVIQISDVIRPIAPDYKVTSLYGGHNVADEKNSLQNVPSIIVGTPGRLLDHANRGNIDLTNVRQLILDEFDKCLELGFEEEMRKLLKKMPNLSRKILTSATILNEIPKFVNLREYVTLDFLESAENPNERTTIWQVKSEEKDKLAALRTLLYCIPQGKTIIFANYRDAVSRIYQNLKDNQISAGIYHGALEQMDREKAIAMFNNESYPILVSTDLGSRGLDIKEVKNIIHYHLPVSQESYTHRNGRTARVDKTGDVYILTHQDEQLPDFVTIDETFNLPEKCEQKSIVNRNSTLYFKAGKKEKISKADIVGFIANNSQIAPNEIGVINVYDHYALVAIPKQKAKTAVSQLLKAKIKGKKIRIEIASAEVRISRPNNRPNNKK